MFRLIMLVCGGIRVEGREHVPRKGGVLITPNHISDADPPTIVYAVPRGSYIMAKEELFQMRVVGTLIRWLRGFPVKRYSADRAALKKAEDLLKLGKAVIIFPEGQIAEDAKLQPMLPGALLVAQRAKVPIVPAIIINSDDLMPYTKLVPRRMTRGPIIVRFGPVVTVEELAGGKKGSAGLKAAAYQLRECMRALQDGKPYPEARGLMDEEAAGAPALEL